ncbi:Trichothecene biosynthesis transcription regulator TRI6 [Colletotrichum siamense]|nr:Trichothecene biosynthesis transcription regulator TRI6 [Colletotrichum siamense]
MESYLEETSYTFFPSVDGSMGYTFDSQFIPYPSGDSLDSFLYPFSFQTCQQPMPMMATSPTLSMDSDFTFNTAYATPSPPPDFSPVPSEQFEFAPSPSSVTTSPSSPPKEPEVDSWGPSDLHQMGYLDVAGNWRCRYAGCCSSRVFLRACDLRKHFRGHAKYFFCTEKRCQQAGVGFATRKDFQRHMGSHKPAVRCLHPDCDRIFSRKDNMGTLQKDSPTVKKQLVSSAMPQDHAERASAGRFSGIDLLKLHDGFLN